MSAPRARLLAAVVAGTLALAAPAAAQDEPQGEPVVGGGTPNAAPLLEPGRYRDTILSGETLFYAIRLEPGEQLRLRATVDADEETWEASSVYWLEGEVRTSLREQLDIGYAEAGEDESEYAGDPGETLERLTEPTGTLRATADEDTRYLGPGVWYASIYARPVEGERKRVEVPYTLELLKEGSPVADQPASGVPAPPREAEEDTGPDEEADEGTSTGTVAAVGVGGLLVGLVAGLAVRRRRRAP